MRRLFSSRTKGKSFFAALAMTAFIASPALAQTSFHLGPAAGVQMSFMQSNLGNYNPGMGYNAGLTSDLRFGANWGIQFDALYSFWNADYTGQDSVTVNTSTLKHFYDIREYFGYAQGHLLFKFNLPLGPHPIIPYDRPYRRGPGLSFMVGPYFGYLMQQGWTGNLDKMILEGEGPTADTVQYRRYKADYRGQKTEDYVNPIDIGITARLGFYYIVNERNTWGIDIGMNRSMMTIDNGYWSTLTFAPRLAPDGSLIPGIYDPFTQHQQDVFNMNIGAQIYYRRMMFGKLYRSATRP